MLGGGASALSNDGGGSWLHSRYLTINNTGNTLTDYQVLVNLTGADFPIEANTSGADIRFTDAGGAELAYWIESWDYANASALVWVNVTSIPAGASTIKMWWGNPSATSSSNGTNTFEFFEDWDYSEILDPAFISKYNYWTTAAYWPSTGVVSFSNSKLELTTVSSDWSTALVASKASYPINQAIDMRLNYGCSGIYCSIAYVAKAGWGLENDGGFWNAGKEGSSVGNYWGNKVLRNTNITDYYDVNSGESQFPNSYETYTVSRLSTKSILLKNYVFDIENSNGYVDTNVNVSFGKQGNWQVPFTIFVDWYKIRKYSDPEPSVSSTNYNLTGHILNASSGLAIPGALVKLDSYPQYNATTNSTGDYAMSVPSGTFIVSATAYDYSTNTTTVTINGDTVNDFALSMLPPIRFINGTVIDSLNRTGIAGAKVFANASITTTNASGLYSFAVPSGSFNMIATFEPTYYSNSSISVSTIGKAVAWQEIELLKKPTGNITGSVTG